MQVCTRGCGISGCGKRGTSPGSRALPLFLKGLRKLKRHQTGSSCGRAEEAVGHLRLVVHVVSASTATSPKAYQARTRGYTRQRARRGRRPCSCAAARTPPAAAIPPSARCPSAPSPSAAAPATATRGTPQRMPERRPPRPHAGPGLAPRTPAATAATCCAGAAPPAGLSAAAPEACAAAGPPASASLAGLSRSCAAPPTAAADVASATLPACAARHQRSAVGAVR